MLQLAQPRENLPSVSRRYSVHSIRLPQNIIPKNMGQDNTCMLPPTDQDAFLENQMRIYQWRSDSRTNSHIPRVSFSSSSAAYKHRFASFLQRSPQQSLNLEDFKHEAARSGLKMVMFQRYACTMEDVEGVLAPSEAAYVLTTLSAAYAQLLTHLGEVVVSRNCWHITKEGQVRAWINHDPRCNFIDPYSCQQKFEQDNTKAIAFKILSEVLKCCQETADIIAFFAFIREGIEEKEQSSADELFEFMRQRISFFSGKTGLSICTSIEAALKRGKQRSESVVASSITCNQIKSLNETRLTGCTWNDRSTHKSNSAVVAHSQFMKTSPFSSLFESPSILLTNTSSHWQPSSNFSNIMNTHFRTESLQERVIQQRHNIGQAHTASRVIKVSESLEKTQKPKPIIKLSDSNISKPKCPPVQLDLSRNSSKHPTESIKISLENDILISGNILTEDDGTAQLIHHLKPYRHQYRVSHFSKNSKEKGMQRKVSIMFEEQEQNLHAHTCHEVISNSLLQQVVQMPWRTNKTITRLINDDTDSLVHSIGTSSDDRPNSSPYSGILAQMGRDITRKEIANSIQSSQKDSLCSQKDCSP